MTSDDYLCITVHSRPDEPAAAFSARLSAFWSGMLRHYPDDFERVYAETTKFEEHAGRLSRQYLAEAVVADMLEREFGAADLSFDPLDRMDLYSKYEASPPGWMQIEH